MPAGDKCPVCGAGLLPLFTGTYCPRGDDDHAAWREEVRAAQDALSVPRAWVPSPLGPIPLRLPPNRDDDPTQP